MKKTKRLDKAHPVSNCPVCGEKVGKADKLYFDLYVCPNKVTLPNGKDYNHYYCDCSTGSIRVYMLPYKIMIYPYIVHVYHQIKNPKTTNTAIQFKKIIDVPPNKIKLDNKELLLKKLNTWMVFK